MTVATQPMIRLRTRPRQAPLDSGLGWPRDIVEAFVRPPGPYTLDDVSSILDEEPVELLNGWYEQLRRLQTGVETAATCAEWLALAHESDPGPRPQGAAG